MSTIREIDQMCAIKFAELEGTRLADDVIWEEEPVGFREFCESPSYLGTFKLSDLQYNDVAMLIGDDPKNTFNPRRLYDIEVLVYGKGGGKDEVASRVAVYVVYLLLCLANPQEYLLGIRSSSTLHLINVAKKGRQAEKIFFNYFSTHIMNSRWFKDNFDIEYKRQYHSKVKKRSRHRGKIIMMTNGAIFPKHIEAVSETTENESWEGYNPVFFVLDEISGFTSAVELERAWKIYNTARSSVETRVAKNFRGMGMVISYPRQEEGDVILELFKYSQGDDSRLCGSLSYPWFSKGMHNFSGEMIVIRHPRLDDYFGIENVGVEVPIEYAGSFTIENIADSITKLLCIPPPTAGGWIEYPEVLKSLVSSKVDVASSRFRLPLFTIQDRVITTRDKDGMVVRYLTKSVVNCQAKTQFDRFQIPRVAWLDAAEKHCDAVIVIGHLEQRIMDSENGPIPVETVVIDDEIIWRPDDGRGIRVSLANVETWLTNILPKHINLVAVGADQWNSAHLEESLRYLKIKTIIHNIKRDDYDLFKRQAYLRAIDFIDGEAVGQFNNLVDAGVKQKPVKKPNFLQDAADAVVGVTWLLVGQDKNKRSTVARKQHIGMPAGVTAGSGRMGAPTSAPVGVSAGGAGNVFNPAAGGSGISPINIPMSAIQPRVLRNQPGRGPQKLPGGVVL